MEKILNGIPKQTLGFPDDDAPTPLETLGMLSGWYSGPVPTLVTPIGDWEWRDIWALLTHQQVRLLGACRNFMLYYWIPFRKYDQNPPLQEARKELIQASVLATTPSKRTLTTAFGTNLVRVAKCARWLK